LPAGGGREDLGWTTGASGALVSRGHAMCVVLKGQRKVRNRHFPSRTPSFGGKNRGITVSLRTAHAQCRCWGTEWVREFISTRVLKAAVERDGPRDRG
jgi:hypothetical protein